MELINCPECKHQIIDKIGTICPNCGHTVGYFEDNKKRKRYGRFFALNIFLPFISFISIVFLSFSKISLTIATIIFALIAFYSCPLRYKKLMQTKFEKFFFSSIWLIINSLFLTMILNIFYKLS